MTDAHEVRVLTTHGVYTWCMHYIVIRIKNIMSSENPFKNDDEREQLRKKIASSLLSRLQEDFFFYKNFMKTISRVEKDGKNISIDDSMFLIDAILGEHEGDVARIVGKKPEEIMNFITELMQSDDIKDAADNISLKK